MNRKIKMFLLGLLGYFMGYSQLSPVALGKLDSFISKTMQDWHVAGVAIAVVDKDSSLYLKGYGYRNLKERLPVTPQTIFPIASCSKTFAAALTGMAVEEGKLNLDTPVHSYLPQFRLSNNYLTEQVTVEDLLTHRTGIPGHDWAWAFNTDYSHEEYLKRISHLEASAPLRTKWQYNTFMYLVVSILNEKVLKKDWDHLVKERLFDPLEMHNSYSGYKVIAHRTNLAMPYSYTDSFHLEERSQIDDLEGGGAINSTAEDLAHWLQMWIAGGTYQGKKLLSTNFIENAISSHFVVSNGLPDQFRDEYFENMGLGWFLSSYRGHYKAQHTGNLSGYSSKLVFYPYDSIGIVVLTNQNNSPLIRLIPDFIADLCFHLPLRDKHSIWLAEKKELLKKTMQVKADTGMKVKRLAHTLSSYRGSFYNPGYGHLSIDTLSRRLILSYAGMKLVLLPEGPNSFSTHYLENQVIAADGIGKVSFIFNGKGVVSSLHIPLEPTVKDIVFTKQ